MSEVLTRDIVARAGGRTLLRYGVASVGNGGIGRTEEPKEAFLRAAPARLFLDRDGNYRDAGVDTPRLHYPPGILGPDGLPLPGILLEHGRQNRIENGDVEQDLVGCNTNVASQVRDQTHVRHGSWAAKVTTTNANGSGPWWAKRVGGKIAATAGRRYTLAVDVFAESDAVGKSMNLRIEWRDAGDLVLSNSTQNYVLVAGWQRLTLSALAPANTTQVAPTLYTNGAIGVFNFWWDLADFAEAAYAIEPTPTNTAAATPATDDLVVPVNLGMDIDWTIYIHALAAHGNLASWTDGENTELDPFGMSLYPSTAETESNRTLRLHRQNSAASWEWEFGTNSPTASRTFVPGTAPQKLVLRHYASDHHLDLAIDGSAFAVSAAPAATITFVPFTLWRLSNHTGFSARAGNWTLFDAIIAKGLRTQADMEAIP